MISSSRQWLQVLVLACLAGAAQFVLAAEPAGRVELVNGSVQVLAPDGSSRQVAKDDVLVEGETVVTGSDGEMLLVMEDNALLSVRPDSKVLIERYRANGDDEDSAAYSLLVGAIRSITGWIGKNNPQNYRINTPTAAIGVRGTDHETMVIAAGGPGDPGTYDKVNEGITVMITGAGEREVTAGRAGYVSHRNQAPTVLARVPEFLQKRVAPNEAVINRLKPMMKQGMDDRLRKRRLLNNQKRQLPAGTGRSGEGGSNDSPAHNADDSGSADTPTLPSSGSRKIPAQPRKLLNKLNR